MTQNLLCSAYDLAKALTKTGTEAGKFVSALWKNRTACIEDTTEDISATKYPGLFVCGAVQFVKERVKTVTTCFKDLKKNKAWKTVLAEAGKSACDIVGNLASAIVLAPTMAAMKLPSLLEWASDVMGTIAKTASATTTAAILKYAAAKTTDQATQYLRSKLQTTKSCAAFLPIVATTPTTTGYQETLPEDI